MCFEEGGKTQTSLRHDPQPRHQLRKIPAGDHALMPLLDPNHSQIHCALEGSAGGPALVLSNSLGTDFSMWDPLVSAFTKAFRVLRYDTRGHGKSFACHKKS